MHSTTTKTKSLFPPLHVRDTKGNKKSQTDNSNASVHASLHKEIKRIIKEVLHMYYNNIFGKPHAEYTKSIIQVNFSLRLYNLKFRRNIPSFPFIVML